MNRLLFFASAILMGICTGSLTMVASRTVFAQVARTFAPTPTPTSTPTPSPTPTTTPSPTPTPRPKPTATPTPTLFPTPTPVSATAGQLDGWFTAYSNQYSVDRTKLWNIAVCESDLKPNAINEPYGGLFQFSASTWKSTRQQMNADTNTDLRFNPEEAIRTAAFHYSVMGLAAWPNCGNDSKR